MQGYQGGGTLIWAAVKDPTLGSISIKVNPHLANILVTSVYQLLMQH
jgi:hypothetical protein